MIDPSTWAPPVAPLDLGGPQPVGSIFSRDTVARSEFDAVVQENGRLADTVDVITESMADLELALDDAGWERLDHEGGKAFTRQGLHKIATRCRTYSVANPLIKNGLSIRAGFVFGLGVTVNATANGKATADGAEQQDVDAVIRTVWDNPANRRAFTGPQAQMRLEHAHGTDGGVFVALWTSPLTGFVRIRTVPFDEVQDVITDPEDRETVQFYVRQFDLRTVGRDGRVTAGRQWAAHPAVGYRPTSRTPSLVGYPGASEPIPIMWDAPMIHTKVNALDGWKFGIGDAYAALPWARMDRDYLRNWSVVMESLAQFTWSATPKGQANAKKSQALRSALARAPQPGAGTIGSEVPGAPGNPNPSSVGATAFGMDIQAIPKSGATIDANASKPFKSYVAAALGVPITQLTGDPGTTGARAVAETLDGPQQLLYEARRAVWADLYRAICTYIITESVRAPRGTLLGYVEVDEVTGEETVTLADDAPTSVDVTFPSFADETTLEQMQALQAATTVSDQLPVEWLLRRVLELLRAEDVDEVLDQLRDEDGRITDTRTSAGDQAVQRFRQGEDPADLLR